MVIPGRSLRTEPTEEPGGFDLLGSLRGLLAGRRRLVIVSCVAAGLVAALLTVGIARHAAKAVRQHPPSSPARADTLPAPADAAWQIEIRRRSC
jgi:hypothetical protein